MLNGENQLMDRQVQVLSYMDYFGSLMWASRALLPLSLLFRVKIHPKVKPEAVEKIDFEEPVEAEGVEA